MTIVPTYVDRKTACFHLCLSRSTFDLRVSNGDLPQPVDKLGKKHLWRWAEIEAALNGDSERAHHSPIFRGIGNAATKKGKRRAPCRRPCR